MVTLLSWNLHCWESTLISGWPCASALRTWRSIKGGIQPNLRLLSAYLRSSNSEHFCQSTHFFVSPFALLSRNTKSLSRCSRNELLVRYSLASWLASLIVNLFGDATQNCRTTLGH
jgi:hypothetical protein